MAKLRGLLALLTSGAVALRTTPHLPSLHVLCVAVQHACAELEPPPDGWITPEDAASASSQAIARLSLPVQTDALSAGQAVPPQGEYRFEPSVDHIDRFAAAQDAAYEGDSRAQHTLGLLHFSGVGGAPHDVRASAYWHAAAAAQGNIEALAVLGGCVRRGVGAARDPAGGVALIRACAAAGSPGGLVKLGVLLDEGELPGVGGLPLPAEPTRAARCFAAAAAQGSPLGLFNFGWALVHGIGVPRDVVRGMAAWRKAAERAPDDGSEEAAYHLYAEQGLLTPRQRQKLRPDRWLRLSASLGFERAEEALAERQAGPDALALAEAAEARRDRFIRNDKARAWTMREERAEAMLDPD